MSLLFDESYEQYRQLEITEGVKVLKDIENGKEPPDYFRGAMQMLRAIIFLPSKLAAEDSEEQAKQADELKEKALKYFEAKMIRSYLE